jgi:hypothetical protein
MLCGGILAPLNSKGFALASSLRLGETLKDQVAEGREQHTKFQLINLLIRYANEALRLMCESAFSRRTERRGSQEATV